MSPNFASPPSPVATNISKCCCIQDKQKSGCLFQFRPAHVDFSFIEKHNCLCFASEFVFPPKGIRCCIFQNHTLWTEVASHLRYGIHIMDCGWKYKDYYVSARLRHQLQFLRIKENGLGRTQNGSHLPSDYMTQGPLPSLAHYDITGPVVVVC